MPPEILSCHLLQTPFLQTKLCYSKRIQKQKQKIMFTKRKLIPILVFILCSASILRFLNISMITSKPSIPLLHIALPPAPQQQTPNSEQRSSNLTEKETRFLWEFFSSRAPCNLLIFGYEDRYSTIASINAAGLTLFLEDGYESISNTNSSYSAVRVRRIMYNTLASEAYQLLKDARGNPNCLPTFPMPKVSRCKLALNLPPDVYDTAWDIVVVDGPRGDSADSPGRMASIYTASLLARTPNPTHVVVHDVDRMIEKWFSWEFLCEENLISSKGKFWIFRVIGTYNATEKFCTR